MSNITISQLPAATTPLSGTEVLPVVQSGTTKQVSVGNLTAGRTVSATTVSATTVSAATVSSTVVSVAGNLTTASASATGNVSAAALIPTGSTVPTNGMYTSAANTLNFATDSASRVTIDSAGDVGIGTSAPSGAFGGPVLAIYSSSNQPRIALKNAVSGDAGGDGFQIGLTGDTPPIAFLENRENGPMTFSTNALERMRIDSSGNVGIGAASPLAKLHVNTTSAALYIGYGANFDNYLQTNSNTIFTNYNRSAERMRIDSSGNVGIGTNNPTYKLQLSTDSAAKPSTNTWTIASDERIKNVTGEYTKGLDAVCALRPITYEYNGAAGFEADGKENISIIAQEAIEHFPECVGTFNAKLNETDETETELYNWNGHALTFALVNAIKELKAELDSVKAELQSLKGN